MPPIIRKAGGNPGATVVQRIVNAFTVDVEDYFQVSALAPVIARDTWSEREYRVEANTDRVLAALADHGVYGMFFLYGDRKSVV